MILSDETIRRKVREREIEVEPYPEEEQFQPASLDVRIGPHIHNVFTGSDHEANGEITLMPETFYLGHTLDHVSLPNDIAAQLAGRSSIGRDGVVVHKTAGWIDPGFSGEITLEIFNFNNQPAMLEVGQRVGQLVFFPTDQPTSGYDGQYQGQQGPTQ